MVGIMTFREMHHTHKVLITVAIFMLMGIELRDIRKDHIESEQRIAKDRKEAADQFSKIADGLKESIDTSHQQFVSTIEGVKTAIAASTEAVNNTRPRAILEFTSMTVYGPSLPISIGKPIKFNVNFTNTGNDVALQAVHYAHIYVDRPDDNAVQVQIYRKFDQWATHAGVEKRLNVEQHTPAIFSFDSEPFTAEEVADILSKKKTLYVLIRFTWVDTAGIWISDTCAGYQDATHDLSIGHPCHGIGFNHRYAGKLIK